MTENFLQAAGSSRLVVSKPERKLKLKLLKFTSSSQIRRTHQFKEFYCMKMVTRRPSAQFHLDKVDMELKYLYGKFSILSTES